MRTTRKMNRLAVARRLQALALALAAGKPVKIGRTLVRVPERLVLEEELEHEEGVVELELELRWPAPRKKQR